MIPEGILQDSIDAFLDRLFWQECGGSEFMFQRLLDDYGLSSESFCSECEELNYQAGIDRDCIDELEDDIEELKEEKSKLTSCKEIQEEELESLKRQLRDDKISYSQHVKKYNILMNTYQTLKGNSILFIREEEIL